jgi:hypothetical protein
MTATLVHFPQVAARADKAESTRPVPQDPTPGHPPEQRVVARSSSHCLVFASPDEVWAFEARGRLVFVHATFGRFDVDVSLSELEGGLGPGFLRVHRNWIVSLGKVRELRWQGGMTLLFAGDGVRRTGTETAGVEVPVAKDRVAWVRQRLFADALGVARRNRGRGAVCPPVEE